MSNLQIIFIKFLLYNILNFFFFRVFQFIIISNLLYFTSLEELKTNDCVDLLFANCYLSYLGMGTFSSYFKILGHIKFLPIY